MLATHTNDDTADAWTVARLVRPVEPIGPTTTCAQAAEKLVGLDGGFGLPVVANGEPLALISRRHFLTRYSDPLMQALFERRSISSFLRSMGKRKGPLAVDHALSLERLKELITTEFPEAVIDGFIIVRDGRYIGVSSGIDVLALALERARSQMHALETAREDALRASRAKSAFLANMSHELRTPLNAVIGFSELIESVHAGNLNERQREYIGDIRRAGYHLLTLINDILDLSRAEAGKLQMVEEEFDVDSILVTALRMLEPRAQKQNVRCIHHPAPRSLRIYADRQKLLQVAINLLGNAVKFTPAGGEVRVECRHAKGGGAVMVFSDTGVGIAADELELIVQPFERGRHPSSLAQEGTGIGLPLAKSLVEMHGGRLTIASVLNVGTEVVVHLPSWRDRDADDEDDWLPGIGPRSAVS